MTKHLEKNVISLPIGGIYKYRHGGETHGYQAKTMHLLQSAVTNDSTIHIENTQN